MTFIITLISLAIERFFDWSHGRRWRWFTVYQTWVSARLRALSAYVVLAVCVLPPVLIVGVINCALSGWLYGVIQLVFGVVILVYCLGPHNFWAQAYAGMNSLQHDDPQIAKEKIRGLFGVVLPDDAQSLHRGLINALFIEAHRRIFAVLFWFMLLGPVGAMLYRTVDLCREGLVIMPSAMQVQRVLDWLPARLLAFIFALGGHFTEVIRHGRPYFFAAPRTNDTLISTCGVAALDVLEQQRIPEDGSAEKETLALFDRVFSIALVIAAIAVLELFR